MGAISEAHLKEVERRIVTGMVETFGVDLSGLVLDMTNFATNAASPVMPRRGAVVIMGLVVSGVDDGWGLLDAA
jgi:uncharacterized protein (DUF1697 family)